MNSKAKGNRGELELVKILNKRFEGYSSFARVPGSGMLTGGKNRERTENMSEEAKLTLSSDIITPPTFRFTIEHKFYSAPDFWNIIGDNSDFTKWFMQATDDAEFCKREAMVVMKFNRHKRLVLIKDELPKRKMTFAGYSLYWLSDILELEDSFFFSNK